jgi:hypothetical protein
MHRAQHMEPDWKAGYCLSWMATRRGDNVYVGHGGGIHGFNTQILFNKLHRTGVIVLANGIGPVGEIAIEMLELLMAAEHDVAKPVVQAQPIPTPPQWKRFLGRYLPMLGGSPVHIECRAGVLILTAPPTPAVPTPQPTHLEPTDQPHVFVAKEGRLAGEPLTFRLAADGAVTGFTVSGFPYRRLVAAAG